VWQQFGLIDGVTIAKGVLLGAAATQLIILYRYEYVSYSRTVFLIYAVLLLVLVTVSRASFRLMGEFIQRQRNASRRAVVYGAGENAALALRELNDRQDIPLKVLGFIDDNHRFARMRVQGYPVLGTFDLLLSMIRQGDVHVVVLNHEVTEDRLTCLEDACLENGVSLLRLHISIEELISTDGPSPATRLRARLRSARG